MNEDQLQAQVMAYLDLALPKPPTAMAWHTPNAGWRHKATAGRLKAMGTKPGVSDVLILHGGRLHAIELKVGRNDTTEAQEIFLDVVSANGGNTATCRSLDEVIGVLRAWGVIPRPTLHRIAPTATGASYTTTQEPR